jgi:hypothetical protein
MNNQSFISLPTMLDFMDYKHSFAEANEMADYLYAKGFVTKIHKIGDILLQITPSGMIEIEEKDEGFNERFQNYMNSISGIQDKVLETKTFETKVEPKTKVKALVDTIKDKVKQKEGKKSDYLKDLDIMKKELSKTIPDFRILEIKINVFDNFDIVSEEMNILRNYIVHSV